MIDNKTRDQKRSQKESQLKKEISKLFFTIKQDNSIFQDLQISSVKLSSDKSFISVFFFTPHGEADFKEKLKFLILYKPSMRKALSQLIKSRYTPQIKFAYDKTYEKQEKLELLLDKIKEEDQF